jgi:hypothetical protein
MGERGREPRTRAVATRQTSQAEPVLQAGGRGQPAAPGLQRGSTHSVTHVTQRYRACTLRPAQPVPSR